MPDDFDADDQQGGPIMGAKIASFLATLLLSIPLAAIGLMAVFGVPQVLPAGPEREQVVRGIQNALNWRTDTQTAQTNAIPAYEDAIPFGQQSQSEAPVSAVPMQQSSAPFASSASPAIASGNASPFQSGPFGAERNAQSANQSQPVNHSQSGQSQASPFGDPRGTMTASAPASGDRGAFAASQMNARAAGMQNSGMSPMSGPTLTWRQASIKLADLGITDFHLERGATEGTFLFVCLYSPGDAPQVTHRFEAESDDPLLAVNQVLQQVDGWMQTRFARSNYPARGEGYSLMSSGQR